MAVMTASGWEAAGVVVVLRTWRPWGPQGGRQAMVQLNLAATNFGNGAELYPTDGVPPPNPSLVGFRDHISYIIPISPFLPAAGPGAGPSLPQTAVAWGCVPPTFGASGTGNYQCRLRLFANRAPTLLPGAEATYVGQVEFTTGYNASTIFGNAVRSAYGIFVEG